jgi:hypothetical protein
MVRPSFLLGISLGHSLCVFGGSVRGVAAVWLNLAFFWAIGTKNLQVYGENIWGW